jgi:ectoine hydroxylase-related dioxygenase (phytanoyl-CoA dioxygenase family)
VAAENGPLRVIPGSHRAYRQTDDPPRAAVAVHCRAGDALLMRPLVTHASGHSKPDGHRHRRIIHLACAADPEPPGGCAWHWFVAID